jgi:hypothetical protein
MSTFRFLAIGAALLLLTGEAAAGPREQGARQQPASERGGPPPGAERGGPPPGEVIRRSAPRRDAPRERLRQRIRAMRAWYLTEELHLDDATAARLFPVLSQFDDRIDEVHRRGVELRRGLRRQLATSRPDSAAVNRLVDALLAHYDDLYRVQRERFAAVRKVVTPGQAAKLLLLLPKIDEAIRRQIRRALRGQRSSLPDDGDESWSDEPRKNRGRSGGAAPPFADPF